MIRASLALYRMAALTDYQRKLVADWLRAQADTLQRYGREYATRYRARKLEKEVSTMAQKKSKKKSPAKKTGY